MLKITAIGNLTNDVELRSHEDGKPYAILRIASDRRYRDRDGNKLTDFISIKVRGALAERCAAFAYCYTLLITELGTEIIALTLHYCFNCATIVADSAIEDYEICLPHTYILYSFALFFYPVLTLDSHSYIRV